MEVFNLTRKELIGFVRVVNLTKSTEESEQVAASLDKYPPNPECSHNLPAWKVLRCSIYKIADDHYRAYLDH